MGSARFDSVDKNWKSRGGRAVAKELLFLRERCCQSWSHNSCGPTNSSVEYFCRPGCRWRGLIPSCSHGGTYASGRGKPWRGRTCKTATCCRSSRLPTDPRASALNFLQALATTERRPHLEDGYKRRLCSRSVMHLPNIRSVVSLFSIGCTYRSLADGRVLFCVPLPLPNDKRTPRHAGSFPPRADGGVHIIYAFRSMSL